MRRLIQVGETYGKIKVISRAEFKCKTRYYQCTCLSCGKTFVSSGQLIFKHGEYGCSDCRKKKRQSETKTKYEQYIGMRKGQLVLTEILDFRDYANCKFWFCRCHCDCGNDIEIPIKRFLSTNIQSCHTGKENLINGQSKRISGFVDGTNIFDISPDRKLNKNNSSGIKGVSWVPKYGKYRAYITLQGKQRHLGMYDTLQEAADARKRGEKKYFEPLISNHDATDSD